MPKHAQGPVTPHTIVTLPNTNGMQLLLCYDNEGVYVNTYGKVSLQSREWSGQSVVTELAKLVIGPGPGPGSLVAKHQSKFIQSEPVISSI